MSDDDDVPVALSESTLMFMGVELRVYNLSNGQRVINKDDFHRLLELMNSGELKMTRTEIEKIAEQLK